MVIMMELNAPEESINKVRDKVSAHGCKTHLIYGAQQIAVGITGPTNKIDEREFIGMPNVVDAIRVSQKFKLVSREIKKDDTIINVGGAKFGDGEFQVIAGPCSLESREQVFRIAEILRNMGIRLFRGGAYKPRTSPYAFQGMKEEGLRLLEEIRKQFDMLVVTEAKDTETLELIAQISDIVQIGARNMQNFSLLEKAGKINKPVLLKRGGGCTVEDLLMSAEYILSEGNFNVILCERGIKTFETYTRNTLDLNAVPVVKKLSHLPIIVDPSHGVGIRDKVPPMSLASAACGANGLIIEVHHEPEKALSDGFQSLTPDMFEKLLNKLNRLLPIVDKELKLYETSVKV